MDELPGLTRSHVELHSDLPVTGAIDCAEQKRVTLGGRKGRNLCQDIAHVGARFSSRLSGAAGERRSRIQRNHVLSAAKLIDCGIADQDGEPRGDIIGRTLACHRVVRAQQRHLNGVLGPVVAKDPQRNAHEPGTVALDKHLERPLISSGRLRDQTLI